MAAEMPKALLKSFEPPRYDGKGIQEAKTFITAVATYLKVLNVTDVDHSILLALSKLDGIAAEWAGPYRDNFLKDTEDRDKSL